MRQCNLEQYEPRIKAIWGEMKEYSEDGLVTDEERTNIKNDIDGLSKEVADAAGEISDAWKDSGEEVRKRSTLSPTVSRVCSMTQKLPPRT